jgi:predicted TIM-barrel fold metal-dependent hydrolase
VIDHHVHVFSDASRADLETELGKPLPPLGVDELLAVMDRDGVERAAVLSAAYFFVRRDRHAGPDAAALARENDWLADEIKCHADRLVGFFSVNPLHPFARDEINRCADMGVFTGLKLHLANSNVDLRDPAHQEALAATLAAADRLGLVVVVHLRTRRPDYGREDVEGFLGGVLPEAARVPVQIAHLGGWGGYDAATDAAFGAFADHVASGVRTNVYFDVSAVVIERCLKVVPEGEHGPLHSALGDKLGVVGLDRVLFGTDWPEWTPADYLEDLNTYLPLTRADITRVAANRAPWLA